MNSVNEQKKVSYFPFDGNTFSSEWRDILTYLLKGKCGQFDLPLTLKDRLKIFSDILFLKGQNLSFLYTRWPIEKQFIAWKVLIKYLHKQGVLVSSDIPLPISYTDMPQIYEVYININLPYIDNEKQGRSSSVASSKNFHTALSKAIGEGLERYFLHCCQIKKVECVQATYDECVKKSNFVVDLHRICGFFDWQRNKFPQLGYQKDKQFCWVTGRQIFSDRLPQKAYLPAQMVFWGSNEFVDEQILGFGTTNGGGAYFSREGAILSGIHELIQRDAFLIHWLRRISPARIDPATIDDEELQDLLLEITRYKYEIFILYTTLDLEVPSVVALLIDRVKGEPVFSVGGGAGFSVKNAIRQAIYEALSIAATIREGEKVSLSGEYEPFLTSNINKRERIRVWRGKVAEERLSFIMQGKKISYQDAKRYERKFTTQNNELDYLLKKFEKKGQGYSVYVYEVDSSILSNIGYHVTKVLIPKLLPLYLTEHHAPINSERLREVPTRLDHLALEELNPWPHPFP